MATRSANPGFVKGTAIVSDVDKLTASCMLE